MNAEIIAVGSELLLGQIANTNAQFLSKQFAEIGVNVYYHTVVGDNPDRLKKAINVAQTRADLLIFTGGLGPTKDDLTKETIASVLEKKLRMDQEALESIEDYYRKVNRAMSENNKKQALVLEGSIVLPNKNGMAPGMFLSIKEMNYMLLPGPPKEMQPMFLEFGRQAILQEMKIIEVIESRVLRFFGIGESQLETDIADLIDSQTNPTIAPLAGENEVTLRLTAKHSTVERATTLLDVVEKLIQERVGQFFFGYNDTTLPNEAMKVLKEKKLTISSAESLTGGLFSQYLTAIKGASSVVQGGVVCYSNESKRSILHVSKATLENDGAISEQCASELALNVKRLMNTDIGISFTGVAGPDTSEGKPVGTVYIGIALPNDNVKIYPLSLAGSRENIRERSVKYGCQYLIKEILNQ
ncbi:competence/damage-inducible protein A [Bacillus suaedaesalsae]|uniref:Putative competence-damage inducible protein n=1 Tax=Bacillus suaedaesalsae TaxID=2810349 RepID=A0ABS2DLG8_9BACI|nr:competence/damage-inducible protein A [Bacillus suaedaesalsae]MBM6618371.1 competence/damage-inducible protein A [Bacillus suaedaesalsae]